MTAENIWKRRAGNSKEEMKKRLEDIFDTLGAQEIHTNYGSNFLKKIRHLNHHHYNSYLILSSMVFFSDLSSLSCNELFFLVN